MSSYSLPMKQIGRIILQQCGNPKVTHSQLQEFATSMAESDDIWRFWKEFYFDHMMAYMSLWAAARSGNCDLRISAIKAAAPLFHALDRTYYLRLLPHHLSHVASMPEAIKTQSQAGAFSVSLSTMLSTQLAWMNVMKCA
eukprot:scpid69236/ scgid1463/ 